MRYGYFFRIPPLKTRNIFKLHFIIKIFEKKICFSWVQKSDASEGINYYVPLHKRVENT